MTASRLSLKQLGLVLFFLGVLLAFVLSAMMTWADVESISYGFPRVGNKPMGGLSCPAFMNRMEHASFSITLKNSTERRLRPQVQVMISEPGLSRWRTINTPFELEAGQRKTATWDIGAEDIVLGSFVLVKAYTFASYPQPDVEGSCGIFVLSIPGIRADVLFWLWLAASLVFLITGLWLSDFRKVEGKRSTRKVFARILLAALVLFGLFAGYMGWWIFGILVLVVITLALPAMLFFRQNI